MTATSLFTFLLGGQAAGEQESPSTTVTSVPPPTRPHGPVAAATNGNAARAAPAPPAPATDPSGASRQARRVKTSSTRSAAERNILRLPGDGTTHTRKKRKPTTAADEAPLAVYGFEDDDESAAADGDSVTHDSRVRAAAKGRSAQGSKKARELADREPAAVRAARTVFVGNVPLACASNRPDRRALLHHLLSGVADGLRRKADSIRFRSLPFAESIDTTRDKKEGARPSDAVTHSQKRGEAFKARGGLLGSTIEDGNDAALAPEREHAHRFLTPAQKRKVAAITGDINSHADSCVAFVVFADAETARAVIATADGTQFAGRTLRVDATRERTSATATAAATPASEAAGGGTLSGQEERRTCFVGGLDFAENEETLRAWVETTLKQERGEPDVDSITGQAKWVERVRIIRDSATGLGKGFAYVLCKDEDCVDELLALPPEKVKLSKRKLRLQRYKGAAKLKVEADRAAKKTAAQEQRKGIQKNAVTGLKDGAKRNLSATLALAAKLKHLSKEERKALKAKDADRLARRAAKKEAKIVKARKDRKRAIRAGRTVKSS